MTRAGAVSRHARVAIPTCTKHRRVRLSGDEAPGPTVMEWSGVAVGLS